ncbi:MAG: hypothetical protein ACHQQR_10315, partial [Gemmatimonadales bacterium]
MTASAALALCAGASAARAQETTIPWLLGAQFNAIYQNLRPFDSPYSGTNSLKSTGDSRMSHAYGVYFGGRAIRGLQAYL